MDCTCVYWLRDTVPSFKSLAWLQQSRRPPVERKNMSKSQSREDKKRESVFRGSKDVFAQYGFRRTSMSDIAEAAGISRPALYLMFKNKEALFREMASSTIGEATDLAQAEVRKAASLQDRIANAVLAYERIYYEPVADSPHGAELMDVNVSIAADIMQEGHERLVQLLAEEIVRAAKAGEASLANLPVKPRAFVELLMSSVSGLKKKVKSNKDFRHQIRNVVAIFMRSITD